MHKMKLHDIKGYALRLLNATTIVLTICRLPHAGAATLTFADPVEYATQAIPSDVAAGDLNRDSHTDLAVLNYTSNSVSLLFGDGTGSFSAARNIAAGTYPAHLVIADFNNDSNVDIAVASGTTGTLTFLWGDGAGDFPTSTVVRLPSQAKALAATDFNEDGREDLAVLLASTPILLLGNGAGGFAPYTYDVASWSSLNDLYVGDFDGDGHNDLFFIDSLEGVLIILRGTGKGTLIAGPTQQIQDYLTSISVIDTFFAGDLNADGLPDIAGSWSWCDGPWLCGNGSSFSYFSNAAGDVQAPTVSTAIPNVADFDLDSAADLLRVSNFEISIQLGSHPPGSDIAVATTEEFHPFAGAADLNGDHKPDVIWTNENSISVALNTMGCPAGDNCDGTYSLTLRTSPPEAGTATGDGVYAFAERANLLARPNCGWRFAAWKSETGETLSDLPRYLVTMVSNRQLTAHFELETEGTLLLPDLRAAISPIKLRSGNGSKASLTAQLSIPPNVTCGTASSYLVKSYLSADALLTSDDLLLTERKIKPSTKARTLKFSKRFPRVLLGPGTTLFAVVDPDNMILETDKSNNTTSASLSGL